MLSSTSSARVASYWQAAAPPLDGGFRASLPREADVVVIGGGLAGLATANSILQSRPGTAVAVLEREYVGYGASGRNGGLLSPLPAPVWLLTARKGNAASWATATLNARVKALGRHLAGSFADGDVSTTSLALHAQGALTGAALAKIKSVLDEAGIASHLEHRGRQARPASLLTLPTFAVDPFRLTRALAVRAQQQGALICEATAVVSVQMDGAGALVRCRDGSQTKARRVVICSNAYTSELQLPARAIRAKAVRNHMLATAPLSDALRARLSDGRAFIVELNKSYVFYRLHAGRLVYGGIESFAHDGASDIAVADGLQKALARLVERSIGEACPPLSYLWSGRYHSTATELPIIGVLPQAPAIVMNVGYGGTGVALTQIFAPLAASLALGIPPEDPDIDRLGQLLQDTRFPAGGLLSFAGAVVRQLLLGPGKASASKP